MKGKKIITVLLIIILILAGIIYNLISKLNVSNKKQVIKEMTESEQVSNLNSAIDKSNNEHDEYKRYISESKAQLATAITNKGVTTTGDSSLETMTANVNKIVTNPPASLISYDNTSSGLSATNVQDAIDESKELLFENLLTESEVLTRTVPSGKNTAIASFKVSKTGLYLIQTLQRVSLEIGENFSLYVTSANSSDLIYPVPAYLGSHTFAGSGTNTCANGVQFLILTANIKYYVYAYQENGADKSVQEPEWMLAWFIK